MDIEKHFSLEHLLFSTRKCRTCKKEKDLLTDFYQIRKNRSAFPSSYSYECKECTKKRVIKSRKEKKNILYNQAPRIKDVYPDW